MLLIQAINKIQEISALQRNVNFVSAEDVYEAMALPNIDYGAMVFNQTSYHYDIDLGLNRLSFRLFYIDRLTDDESNKLQVQSIGFEVLKEVIKGMNSLSLNPAKGLVFRPFTQKFKDMCAGAYVEMTVEFYDEWTCPDDGYAPLSYDADCEEIITALENEILDLKFANSSLEQQMQDLYDTFQNGMIDIEFDSNGEYNAEDFGASGFRTVEVNVPASGGGDCQESYDEGFADGYEKGNDEGYNEGYSVGHNDGYDLGYVEGQETGFKNGYTVGYNDGLMIESLPKIYTSAEAVDLILNKGYTGRILVKGEITEISEISVNYGNARYKLGDLNIYRGRYYDGENFTVGDEIAVGNWVFVVGNASIYNGVAQINANNYIVSIWDDPSTVAGKWGLTGYFNGWGISSSDVYFEDKGTVVSFMNKDWNVQTINDFNHDGTEVKIRYNNEWNLSYGAELYNEPQIASLLVSDDNMSLSAGTWDIHILGDYNSEGMFTPVYILVVESGFNITDINLSVNYRVTNQSEEYAFKLYNGFDGSEEWFYDYPNNFRFIAQYGNVNVISSYDENMNLTYEENFITDYNKDFSGDLVWNN